MKILLFFVILFGCIEAMAKDCWLSYDQNEMMFVDCRVGPLPKEYKRVCRMIEGSKHPTDYKVQILKGEKLGLLDKAKEFVGMQIDSVRDWSPGTTLEPGESILCRIDESAKQARLDLEEIKQKAKEKQIKDKQDAWKAACDAEEIHPLICKDKGF